MITLPRLLRPGAVSRTQAGPSEDGSGPDGWSVGTTPAGNEAEAVARLQSVQSKFLNAILTTANRKGLGFVVQLSAPNRGSGFIQKTDGFSNLYSFQFEFGEASATLVLGVQGAGGGTDAAGRRLEVPYGDGARMDAALDEIKAAIDEAAREVFPELRALRPKTEGANPEGSTELNSLRRSAATREAAQIPANQDAYRVWTSGVEKRTRDPTGLGPQHHRLRNGLLIFLVVFLLFLLPILSTSGASGPCIAAREAGGCPAPTDSFSASITGHYLGIGADYAPPGLSPGYVAGSVVFTNAGSGYALGDWSYYVVVHL